MSNRRVQQHRQQRETSTRQARDLKKENRQLKREIARLRKQLEKAESPPDEAQEIQEEKPAAKCSKCKSIKLASITTPSGKTIHLCRECGWRGST